MTRTGKAETRRATGRRCTFLAKVKPAARDNGIRGIHAGMLVVHVTAAPERGKANKAVVQTLAKAFGVPKSAVTIRAGETANVKRIAVDGLSPSEYHAFLENLKNDNPQ